MDGREVGEPQVDQWVDEAEAGYDVDALRSRVGRVPRGGTAAKVIPVRLTDAELAAVMARAEREGAEPLRRDPGSARRLVARRVIVR
ncbi:hypothetical protein CMsap09_15735 [Clavibacter michiganensis]|uniref:Uncharacterized protein n=1 Tax=Clavibacter michiganensis TaxID=28447 RepID=A0A251XY65_9MICO|nr:hypothetical protein CMsap09_15735 [Clavibacter michiganensis]